MRICDRHGGIIITYPDHIFECPYCNLDEERLFKWKQKLDLLEKGLLDKERELKGKNELIKYNENKIHSQVKSLEEQRELLKKDIEHFKNHKEEIFTKIIMEALKKFIKEET